MTTNPPTPNQPTPNPPTPNPTGEPVDHVPTRTLARALAQDPGRPLVTFYDDATGERTELSVATFENWVAKTANLMVDGLGLGPGARIALLLPLHWQHAVWLAACWSVGATACIGNGTDELAESSHLASTADLAVCSPDTLGAALSADDVVALSLRPLAGRMLEPLPAGVMDYAIEIPGYGDRFTGVGPHEELTEVEGRTVTGEALLDAARTAARRWGLNDGGRLLTAAAPDTTDGLLAMLPAALVTGGSVLQCRNQSDDTTATARRREAEHVTATATNTATTTNTATATTAATIRTNEA